MCVKLLRLTLLSVSFVCTVAQLDKRVDFDGTD